jgi:hypothetical protein
MTERIFDINCPPFEALLDPMPALSAGSAEFFDFCRPPEAVQRGTLNIGLSMKRPSSRRAPPAPLTAPAIVR